MLKNAKSGCISFIIELFMTLHMNTRLYEDNVSGKISDERFAVMSAGYEDEQKKLRATVAELTTYIENAEQKSADVTAFIKAVQKYEHITELTPEIMHELIEKIVVHAPDKSSGHRTQENEIHYHFNVAETTAVADSMKYDKKRKAAQPLRLRNLIFKS